MKRILLSLMAIMMGGCGYISFNPNPSPSTGSASATCPEKPTTNALENVKSISLTTSGSTKESGQLKGGKYIGYTFEAEAGQKFSYKTKDDICIWIFTSDITLLNNPDLPKTGKYTVQVAAMTPKGSIPFELEMSLGTLQSSATPISPSSQNSPSSNSVATSPQNSSNNTSNSSNTSSSSSPSTQAPPPSTSSSGLTQDQAVRIVRNWLGSKSRIFGPPFDRSLVAKYGTGKLYEDVNKPNGSIDWLRNNNSRYEYGKGEITQVLSYSDSGGQPTLKVRIYEEKTLYGSNNTIDPNNSGSSTKDYTYSFALDNGAWKIYDYN